MYVTFRDLFKSLDLMDLENDDVRELLSSYAEELLEMISYF
jgi:hypothetical protein